ncbi:T9SS type A sorting domain-containing protein [Winogradskyella aurantia]|uniref:Secretion system C-terminal sorting domain-containing protein n=1 Tax=Winogradskyella aurantia TaxID=1915063 RepID=A0A265UZ24_9FLAO|nr:T9SS type A sorting domain-containing protein [Winogradskyella aurantia]OZV70578.1 hypothetical protein CA834_00230 [Winogradskyella aurantia]
MAKKWVFLLAIIFCLTNAYGQNLIENSTGSFIFTPQAPLNRPPIEVFYHIPNGDISNMPILFSFHGATRDGANYRDYWVGMANANGFMIFAPEFSSTNYPGLGDNYLMANIFDDGDNPSIETFNNQNEWTFSILDPLFNHIKADISGQQQKYSAWGHSGGAQFLHRFVMYMPNSNLDTAVCSNAGWYTVPEFGVNFPYGLNLGQLPNNTLISAFSKKLIVHLGEDDTDPNSPGLRHNTIVDNQQGLFRLERGQYFYSTSETTAANLNVLFNWENELVPNVGHEPQLMANDALQYLLVSLSTPTFDVNNGVKIYPNPTNTGRVTISSSNANAMRISVFNVLGKQVKKAAIQPNTSLDVSNLKSGIYIVRLEQNNATTTKKLIIK